MFFFSIASDISSHSSGPKELLCSQPLNVCFVNFIPFSSKDTNKCSEKLMIKFIRYVGLRVRKRLCDIEGYVGNRLMSICCLLLVVVCNLICLLL